jgi:hypothetical protein
MSTEPVEEGVAILEDGTKFVLIHYTYLSPAGTTSAEGEVLAPEQLDSWKIACRPSLTVHHAGNGRTVPIRRSDDPRAVNCPECKRTDQFISHAEALGMLVSRES